MSIRIICIGISVLDRVWPLAALPTTSGKYRASAYLELGGGMAANAAVAAARLGAQVSYWGRGGDDSAGHALRQEMAGYGIDVTHYRLFAGTDTSVSAIFVADDGERMIVNFPGKGIPDAADWLPLEQLQQTDVVIADVRWVEGAHTAFTAARALQIPTVLDGENAGAAAFQTLLPLTDHAIFSESGLRSFAGAPAIENEADCIAALEQVRALGCRVAAVTRGAQGVVWLDDCGLHRQAAFTVKAVDTTGAGDVFHGAYAFALGRGNTISEAMCFASAVAALKCTRQGGRAGIPSLIEAEVFQTQSGN